MPGTLAERFIAGSKAVLGSGDESVGEPNPIKAVSGTERSDELQLMLASGEPADVGPK